MLSAYKILTVSHRRTPLPHIGNFVLPHTDEADLQARLEALRHEFSLEEICYIATCNRVIFFFYSEKTLDAAFSTTFFRQVNPALDANVIEQNAQLLEGEDALQHLLRVASSVDSLVVGEREILRQLRDAYERCRSWNLTGDHLRIAFDLAVAAAKEVYSQTRLGEKSLSVVSLAVKELLKTKLPQNARILMIGAGQTHLLVAKFLKKHGFQNIAVFNRTFEKAQQIAAMTGGTAFPFAHLEHYRGGFDCLFVCTGATSVIVDKTLYDSLLCGETDAKTVIDLSVPNNVAEEVAALPGVHFIEIEDLRSLAQENLAFRGEEVAAAEALLQNRLVEFREIARHRRIERAFGQIPADVKAVRERAMNEVFKKEIESLDDSARLLLERMMTYMEKKCVGIPIKVAKESF